jgi:hypothetical protein
MPGQFNLPRSGEKKRKLPVQNVNDTITSTAEAQIRLNQMLYDRRLSQKAGFDTKNETYAPNAEIARLRKLLRAGGGQT